MGGEVWEVGALWLRVFLNTPLPSAPSKMCDVAHTVPAALKARAQKSKLRRAQVCGRKRRDGAKISPNTYISARKEGSSLHGHLGEKGVIFD